MEKLSIPNIVLTQGETSDTFEIYSKDSLKDFTASFRITNSDGTSLKTKDLSHTKEIKNQDSIFNDNLVYTLTGKEFEIINGINEYTTTEPTFNHKIRLDKIEKDTLSETLTLKGKVFDEEYVDTVKNRTDVTPEEEQYIVESSDITTEDGTIVILHKLEETGIANVEVTITFTSTDKEESRSVKAVTTSDGTFSAELYLGDTIKQEAGQGFVFVIPEDITSALDKGRYMLTVTVSKTNSLDEVVFCKEIIQTKLDINEKL